MPIETLLLGLSITTLFLLYSFTYLKKFFPLIVGALIIRLILIFFVEEFGLFGRADVSDYLRYFIPFSNSGEPFSFFTPHVGFYTLLYPGWIFRAFGEDGLWLIRLINAIIGILCIQPLRWLNKLIFQRDLTLLQAGLILFWPSWLRYTVEVGRTPPSVFFPILAITGFLSLMSFNKKHNDLNLIIISLSAFFFAFYLRTHYIVYFLPLGFIFILNKLKKTKLSSSAKGVLLMIGFLIGIGLSIGLFNVYLNYGVMRTDMTTEGIVESAGERGLEAGSAYLEGINPRSPIDFIWYAPVKAVYFIFSPMPWSISSVFAAGSSIQAMFLLYLCIKGWRNRKYINYNKTLLKNLMISIVFVALTLGVFVNNAGSAERWRFPSTLILITVSSSIAFSQKQFSKTQPIFDRSKVQL